RQAAEDEQRDRRRVGLARAQLVDQAAGERGVAGRLAAARLGARSLAALAALLAAAALVWRRQLAEQRRLERALDVAAGVRVDLDVGREMPDRLLVAGLGVDL